MEKFSKTSKTDNRKSKIQTENGEYGKFATPVWNGRLAPINTANTKTPYQPITTFGIKADGRPAPGHSAARPPKTGPPPTRPNKDVNGLSLVKTKIDDKTKNNQVNGRYGMSATPVRDGRLPPNNTRTEPPNQPINTLNVKADGRPAPGHSAARPPKPGPPPTRPNKDVNGLSSVKTKIEDKTKNNQKNMKLATVIAKSNPSAADEDKSETWLNNDEYLKECADGDCSVEDEIRDSITVAVLDCLSTPLFTERLTKHIMSGIDDIIKIMTSQALFGLPDHLQDRMDRTHLNAKLSQVQKPKASDETCTSDGSGEQPHTESFKKIKNEDSIGSPLISMKNVSVEEQVSRDALQKHSSDSDKFSSSCKTSDHSNLEASLTRFKSNSEVSRGSEFMKTEAEYLKCISSFDDEAKEGHVAESVPEAFWENSAPSILISSHEMRSGDEIRTSHGTGEQPQTESFSKDSFGSRLILMENAVRICSVEKQEVKSPRLSQSKNNDQLCSNGLDQDQSSGHAIKSKDESEATSGSISHFTDKSLDSYLDNFPDALGEYSSTSIVKPPPMPVTHMTPSPPSTPKPVSKRGSAVRNKCCVKESSLPEIHVKSQSDAGVKSCP